MSSKIPNSAPYADTTLIDCSRDTSEEVKGKQTNADNALWTNKVGTGLKLNPGDKVSIASVFVSEKGCGGDVIEFRGEPIRDSDYTIWKTTLVPAQAPCFTISGSVGDRQTHIDETPPLPFGQCQPYNAHRMLHKREKETHIVKDNEAHIQISYFKTVNGDGYVHLPRRWDVTRAQNGPGVVPVLGTPGDMSGTRQVMSIWTPWEPIRRAWNHLGFWGGPMGGVYQVASADRPHNPPDNINPLPYYDCSRNGRLQGNVSHPSIAMDDYYHFNQDYNYNPWIARPAAATTGNKLAGQPNTGMVGGTDTGAIGYRKRNNNDRYTIYSKDVCFFAHNLARREPDPWPADGPHSRLAQTREDEIWVNPPDDLTTAAAYPQDYEEGSDSHPFASRDDFISRTDAAMTSTREPACSGYTKYTEIKKLTVPVGYDAPANVAGTLTDQLNTMEQPKKVIGWTGSFLQDPNYAGARTNVQSQVVVSQTTSSQTFKPFCCANLETFSYENFNNYYLLDRTPYPGTENTQDNRVGTGNGHLAVNYLSSYQYIGVKRPELFDAIRGYYSNQVQQAPPGLNLTWRTLQHAHITSTHTIPAAAHFNTNPVVTNIAWTPENLERMNDVLKVEEKYPELFTDYQHTNIGTNPGSEWISHFHY